MRPNTDHWAKVARSQQPDDWELRSELAAYFVRPTDVICDLGAGAQAIRQMLPHTVEYVPVDCVKEHDGTFVADLNADFSLPDQTFDVILCLGLLRYIEDLPKFFERLIALKSGTFIVFTFGFRKKEQSNDLLRNEIETLEEGIEFFSKYIDGLRTVACVSAAANRFMFCGVLSKSRQNSQPPKLRSMRTLIQEGDDTRRLSTKRFSRLLNRLLKNPS